MTVAAFMDFALYDPQLGYYARAARRSGRTGDFFTSVDVGAFFGKLLEVQLAEMARILNSEFSIVNFDLVEAGASDGRLSADILRAARREHPTFYDRIRLHLVEASPSARAAQRATLGDGAGRLVSSSDALPSSFEGVLIANELVDALPVHQVVMRAEGLREVYVGASACGPREDSESAPAAGLDDARPSARASESLQPNALGVGPRRQKRSGAPRAVKNDAGLVLIEGPPSTPLLAAYLERLGVTLEPGWRVEINLRGIEWIRNAARRLTRGFVLLIDYGHEACELYSPAHAGGTLTTFSGHTMSGSEGSAPAWLERPGEQDITAHVDFTSIRAAAEEEGLITLGFMDQTYFLLGLLTRGRESVSNPADSRPLLTLIMPGGLGSTHKVLILGKGVGTPELAGCSYRMRVT